MTGITKRQGNVIIVLLAITLAFVVAAGIYQFVKINPDAANDRNQLHQTQIDLAKAQARLQRKQRRTTQVLVRSCQDNLNPVLHVLRTDLHRQISQSNSPAIRSLFASAPPDVLDRLIAKSVAELKDDLTLVQPVNCQKRYR